MSSCIYQGALESLLLRCRPLGVQIAPEARRQVLVDLLSVYSAGGKAIVFTQTKRECDELTAAISRNLQCEVLCCCLISLS